MRIVLTRHPGQAGDLEAAVQADGFDVGFLPLTQQLLPADTRELTGAVEMLVQGSFDWLLLTSANTVRALISCGWDGRIPEQTRVAAVGPGTARVLGDLTTAGDPWIPADHSAAGLLLELPGPAAGPRLLLPQSAQARPQLAEGLRARGWDLTHVTAYQSVPTAWAAPQPLHRILLPGPSAEGEVAGKRLDPTDLREDDVVLLTSSTAAEAYAQLQLSQTPSLLAIGGPTAATMKGLGLPVAAVLSEPTAAGLTSALTEQGFSPVPPSLDWKPDARTPHRRHGGD